jgi:UDP-N-acetylglucosamine 2-epimerase (non-hydrolysing)
MKVLVIFGTRPEAVKCFPVVQELRKLNGVDVRVCVTAQHRRMLDQILNLVEIQPDYDLNLMRPQSNLTNLTNDVLSALGEVLSRESPDRVLVQGDTTTTMGATLAAFYRKIPVGHIEAGLRSWNNYSPWPEEVNRKIVSTIADLHFAPTIQARENLLKENVAPDRVYVTGNTVIDALIEIRNRLATHEHGDPVLAPILEASRLHGRRILVVTSHRRENWGVGVEEICRAIRAIADRGDVEIVYPLHLNPNIQVPVRETLGGHPRINLLPPLDYLPFVALMDACYLILTDSGGVQEEAPALGKPVLVLRDTTERPEGIKSGNARLVGVSAERILAETKLLLDDPVQYRVMSQSHNPYGDGKAAARIAEHILGLARPLRR